MTGKCVVELSEVDLALRFIKIAIGYVPLAGMSAEDAVKHAEDTWPANAGPFPFRIMARSALEYMVDRFQNGSMLS